MPTSLDRRSFNVRPLCTGLISTLLNLGRYRHSPILSFILGTSTVLLYHSDDLSVPGGAII